MPKKEDRSDWVAVQPEFASAAKPPEIRKPVSAYQYYQKHATPEIKRRMEGPFDIAKFGRAVRDQWNALSESDQEPFLQLARDDAARYARESQQADAAALERKLQLQKERQSIVVLDIDYDNDDQQQQQRTTRKRLEQHVHQQNNREDASSNDDSPKPKRAVSEKQQAYLTAKRLEHQDKETYIRARHDALRTERAAQAKRRLQYLLQQSSIFSHFGMNQNKNSIVLDEKNSIQKQATTTSSRRDSAANQQEDEAAALEEADEHEAVFLTAQPTTLGHGVMRDYQLEGLNWMIRLQENGVNGILADEMGLYVL
jgi:SWI/SNF-related matrix-associated actin-dependent regulator of chromatin subfamily A member 5